MNMRLWVLAVLLVLIKSVPFFADEGAATHIAKVEAKLTLVNHKGKEDIIAEEHGDYLLNWANKKCNFSFKDDGQMRFAYCKLNLAEDLVNKSNELVMKAMPQAHF